MGSNPTPGAIMTEQISLQDGTSDLVACLVEAQKTEVKHSATGLVKIVDRLRTERADFARREHRIPSWRTHRAVIGLDPS